MSRRNCQCSEWVSCEEAVAQWIVTFSTFSTLPLIAMAESRLDTSMDVRVARARKRRSILTVQPV
jgi:hypothetical protein